jgi:hypothetical protein
MFGLFAASANRTDYYSPYSSGTTAPTADWQTLVVDPIRDFFLGVVSYVPSLLTALCVLVTGWLIGRILQFVVSALLHHSGFNQLAQRTGISKLLSENDGKTVPSRWAGQLVFWIVIVMTFIACLSQLRLQTASSELGALFRFVFTILTGLVIFVAGMALSLLAAKVVRSMAQHLNISHPDRYAATAKWSVLVFTLSFCLIKAGIMSQFVLIALSMIFVTLCITFILAFGIGGTKWAARVLDKTLKEKSE